MLVALAVAISVVSVVTAALLVVAWGRRGGGARGARVGQAMVVGAVWAVGLAFPLAAVCALVYRFPVPLVGYRSGPAAVPGAVVSVVFYGVLLGGFPALLAGGAAAGAVAYGLGRPDLWRVRLLVFTLAGLVAALGVTLVATLDF
jgi:hypothetical protein